MSQKLPLLLCVDDEPEVLNALSRVFRADFEIELFEDPTSALQYIQSCKDKISVIISDFKMSPINGVDFLDQVKALSPTSARIILSGQMEIEDLSTAINQQIVHKFFLKPWDNQVLKIQIQEALQTHKLIAEKDRYKKLSITDPITQLTNHRFFQEKIRLDLVDASLAQPLSLLMIDVDHFKAFNDKFGHPEGDKILFAIAERLKASLRHSKHTVSRYGGEEFTMLMPNTTHEQALKAAEVIRKQFDQEKFFIGQPQETQVTLSIGVSTGPLHSLEASQLIELADQALYQAKRNGRNRIESAQLKSV